MKAIAYSAAIAIAAATAAPATATSVQYPYKLSIANATSQSIIIEESTFTDVASDGVGGKVSMHDIHVYTADAGGGLLLFNPATGYTLRFFGPVLFDGPPRAAPIFFTGTFSGTGRFGLAGFEQDGPLDITISSVPEPANWAMLIGGFGLVGVTMRRRARLPA